MLAEHLCIWTYETLKKLFTIILTDIIVILLVGGECRIVLVLHSDLFY